MYLIQKVGGSNPQGGEDFSLKIFQKSSGHLGLKVHISYLRDVGCVS